MLLLLAIISIVMLFLLYVPGLGVVRGGARRWLKLGPVLLEPSELVKFALVFFLAEFLSKREDRINIFIAVRCRYSWWSGRSRFWSSSSPTSAAR